MSRHTETLILGWAPLIPGFIALICGTAATLLGAYLSGPIMMVGGFYLMWRGYSTLRSSTHDHDDVRKG